MRSAVLAMSFLYRLGKGSETLLDSQGVRRASCIGMQASQDVGADAEGQRDEDHGGPAFGLPHHPRRELTISQDG